MDNAEAARDVLDSQPGEAIVTAATIPGYPPSPVRTPAQIRALVEVLNGYDLRRIQISHGRSHAAVQVIRDEFRFHVRRGAP